MNKLMSVAKLQEMYRALSDSERAEFNRSLSQIDREIWEAGKDEREAKYKANRKAYQEQKLRKKERGEKFKEVLKEGDIVQMEGTKDGRGYRLVESFDNYSITCRKLVITFKKNDKGERVKILTKDKYVTEHMWDKLKQIYDKSKLNVVIDI